MKSQEKLNGFIGQYNMAAYECFKWTDKKAIFRGANELYSAALMGISHTRTFVWHMMTQQSPTYKLSADQCLSFGQMALSYLENMNSELKANPRLRHTWANRVFDQFYLNRIATVHGEYIKTLLQDPAALLRYCEYLLLPPSLKLDSMDRGTLEADQTRDALWKLYSGFLMQCLDQGATLEQLHHLDNHRGDIFGVAYFAGGVDGVYQEWEAQKQAQELKAIANTSNEGRRVML